MSVLPLSHSFHRLLSRCKKQFLHTSASWLLPPPTELESCYPPLQSNHQLSKALVHLLSCFIPASWYSSLSQPLAKQTDPVCTSQNSQPGSQISVFPWVFPPSQIYSFCFFHLKSMPSLSVPLQNSAIHKGPIQTATRL